MPEFLHGIETFTTLKGPQPVQNVRTAVIGLVGTAPIHRVASGAPAANALKLLLSDRDDSLLGPADAIHAGYSIPRALAAIRKQFTGLLFVVNCFNPATHKTDVASASKTITGSAPNKKIDLAVTDLLSVTVTTSADAACVAGTDYTVDLPTGIISILVGGNLASEANAKVAYSRANPAGVDANAIIGAAGPPKTGMQAFQDAKPTYGFGPKILIAPGHSSAATVRNALNVLAQKNKLRAIDISDVAASTTLANVLAGRAAGGSVDLTNADQRHVYAFPYVKPSATELEPFSPYLAGVIAKTDVEKGYWKSPSNKDIAGIVGTEIPINWNIEDTASDANQLNAAGIVTVATGYGTGFKVWGNRNASFPGAAGILTFIKSIRTIDMIEESLVNACAKYLDEDITSPLIGQVLETVNEFIQIQVKRGALAEGSKIQYFDEDNPTSQLSDGQVVFTRTYCPTPPLERMTNKDVIDVNLLKAVS